MTSEKLNEEFALSVEESEEPRSLQEFHAVTAEVACNVSRNCKLAILFKERDKYDLYGRKQVYWALPKETVEKLLKCRTELVREDAFVGEEREIIRRLVVRKWLNKETLDGVVYVSALNGKTAKALKRQLSRLQREEKPKEPEPVKDELPVVLPLCDFRKKKHRGKKNWLTRER